MTRIASLCSAGLLIGTLLTGTMLVTSCSGNGDPTPRDYGQIGGPSGTELAEEQVLRKNNGTEPQTLDAHRAQGVPASNILRDLYETLVSEAPNGDLIPGAAESWTLSEDGRVYTFKLRADGRWSNGDPVTAGDWVFSLRRGVDPATLSVYSGILFPIKNGAAINRGELSPAALGARAIDDRTLEITLENPTPYFLGLLTHSMAGAVHPPSVQQYGDKFARPGTLIGNGAYVLKDWVVQSHVELERNPYYRENDKTIIDRVFYYAIESSEAAFARYRADEIDFTSSIPLRQLEFIRKAMPDEYIQAPYLGTYYYGINTRHPAFDGKPGLRRALSMAIDREILAEKISGGATLPAYGWVPAVADYEQQLPEWHDWSRAERHAEARRLYAEAGHGPDNPLVIEILYNTLHDHKRLAIAIGAMWKQVLGVETQLLNQEWKVFLQTRQLGLTQVYRSGWIGDYNDANTFAELLHSENAQNDTGWGNDRYDELLERAAVETILDKRALLLQEAERIMLDETPLIPIYFYVSKRVVKPWVGGYVPNIMDHTFTKDLYILKH
ncbi:MAG: peptide ABC transporter substrate-binding protein [Gammaproteobacteria bacterium]|nr:peptide ABC transporter substrate-binding protein [Gammaproteobacteria bacterium]NND54342.1 peptide ABC transporter substrate-binding protein [Gammaproteobacteria bacterium]